MVRLRTVLPLTLLLLAGLPAMAGERSLTGFLKARRPTTGQQQFVAGLRVPRMVGAALSRVGLGSKVRHRRLVQVTNANLDRFTRATAKGYLEVVIPAGKGHVFFRHGKQVFDFYQGGFRVGPVRPIRSERYGMLIKLTPDQETRLTGYLARLKKTGGKELGTYDFQGKQGFHCVSWLMRQDLDGRGGDLVQLLGGKPNHHYGMPSFSRFLLKRARSLEAVVVYGDQARSASQLSRLRLQLMSNREIVQAFREGQ